MRYANEQEAYIVLDVTFSLNNALAGQSRQGAADLAGRSSEMQNTSAIFQTLSVKVFGCAIDRHGESRGMTQSI
jgi:hypothetical protein